MSIVLVVVIHPFNEIRAKETYLPKLKMSFATRLVLFYLLCIPVCGVAKLEYCEKAGNTAPFCTTNSLQIFHEATRMCASLEEWRLLYDACASGCQHNRTLSKKVLKVLSDAGRPVWLNLKRTISSAWLTTNQEYVSQDITINGKNPVGNCARLASQTDTLAAVSCSQPRGFPTGFVCEFKGRCPWFWKDQCFKLNSATLLIGYNTNINNWITARALCTEFGGDLFIPKSRTEIKQVIEYLTRERQNLLNMNRVSSFYVGLTKEHWTFPGIPTDDSNMKAIHALWSPGQPAEGNCVIITRGGLNTTDCMTRHATVCQLMKVSSSHLEMNTEGTTVNDQIATTKESDESKSTVICSIKYFIITITLLSVVVVVTMPLPVIVYIQCKKHFRKKKKRRQRSPVTEESQAEITMHTETNQGGQAETDKLIKTEEEIQVQGGKEAEQRGQGDTNTPSAEKEVVPMVTLHGTKE